MQSLLGVKVVPMEAEEWDIVPKELVLILFALVVWGTGGIKAGLSWVTY